jgi:hypothetical protein
METTAMARRHLEKLIAYCPTGTAEGEKGIRQGIFVQFSTWTSLVVPPAYSPIVLVGKKGCGKSILVDFSVDLLEAKGVPCAKLRPRDLSLDEVPESASVSQAHSHAYTVLVKAAAVALGERLTGLLKKSEAAVLQAAIDAGVARPDLISKAAKFLPKVAKAVADVDITALLPDQPKEVVAHLDKSLKSALAETKSLKAVYVFLDDTDQVASPSRPGQLNRIWGLLLAARELAELSPEIRCVITLREEVWIRIANDRASQRDQTDHFYSLVRRLDPTPEQLKLIVRRRLDLAKQAAGEPAFVERYTPFFEGNRPHMPLSDVVTSWEDLIVTRSRGRPRDCVQLLHALAKSALDQNCDKVLDSKVAPVVKAFSESRVDLLAQETEQELPALKDVIKTFARREIYDEGSFKVSSAGVLAHLRLVPSMFSLRLFGVALQSDSAEHALRMLAFLFRIGFLNARRSRPGGRYVHIPPSDEPNLVSETSRNELQSVSWEVHPAFRDFLISHQAELLHRRS